SAKENMSDLEGYKSWLAQLQGQPSFKNNYWCAMLAKDLEENSEISVGMKIPYSIVERELEKEQEKDNVNHSIILRHWIVDLLKAYNEDVNATNYEEVLRDFLASDNILPADITSPLTPSTSFHSLPTECKLWIFYTLRTYKKPSCDLKSIAKDPLSNTYYIVTVPECRLYVKIGKPGDVAVSIDEETSKQQAWESLYRFVHAQQWILLCEGQDSWDVVWKKFLSFKLNNLYNYIKPEMVIKLCGQNVQMMLKEEQRKKFEEDFKKINANELHNARKYCGDAINNLEAELAPTNLNGPVHQDASGSQAAKQHSPQNKKIKCQYFPQCKRKATCKFFHPIYDCRNFPVGKWCPGQRCLFKHGPCPEDENCADLKCVYDHYKSLPVHVRKQAVKKYGSLSRAPSLGNLSQYSSKSRRPSIEEIANEEQSICSEDYYSADSNSDKVDSNPQEQKWCTFLRFCNKKTTTCKYKHPNEKCTKFPECPKGGTCKFLHDVCENDGVCSKEKCDYEHVRPFSISNRWCRHASGCRKFGCTFIHPKECLGPCPTPNNCWMYHPPAQGPMGPVYTPGPVFPGAPGMFPPPPHQIRYGFGPDFTRPAPFPPGPGFPGVGRGGYAPRNMPMGYPPRGGFGTRQDQPPHPPRPTTPGGQPSHPPPTPAQSESIDANREFYDRKRSREQGC
ncbi:hypothetical protein PMAYCL1PPCAC_26736, partial [Pristionchus mayeri]